MGVSPGNQGRFPGYDVLQQASTWDDVTKGVVLARLAPPPALRFFSTAEEATGRALVDRLLAQEEEPRIPVLEMIDARLAEAQTDGWHYEDMPEDGDAWRRSLAALDDEAQGAQGAHFHELRAPDQDRLLEQVRTGQEWRGMPAGHVWDLWMRYSCTAFYSHPWSWNEIGYGGPAYPRGYKNMGLGAREPWEVEEADARDPVPWAERVEAAKRGGR
jgi:hypothetical protein